MFLCFLLSRKKFLQLLSLFLFFYFTFLQIDTADWFSRGIKRIIHAKCLDLSVKSTAGIISGKITNTCMGLGGGTDEQSSTISKTFGTHASFNKHFWDTLLVKQKIWDTLTALLSTLHISAFIGLGYLNWWYLEFLNTPFLPLIYFSHQSQQLFVNLPYFWPQFFKEWKHSLVEEGGDYSWQWLGMIIVSFRGQNQGFGIF